MKNQRKVLGMLASELCRRIPENEDRDDKAWFHVRKFIRQHHKTLNEYEITATDGTADIIDETSRELEGEPGFEPLTVNRLGSRFRGVVRLAAQVAEGQVDRVLFFEDPEDVQIEHPENYALLRNCNLNGKALLINEAAHLWAANKEGSGPMKPRFVNSVHNGMDQIPETVVFIAHDREKDRMARLALRYHIVLHWFPRLLATCGTKTYLDKFLKATLPSQERLDITPAGRNRKDLRGARGGDVIVADEIFHIFEGNPGLLNDNEGPLYHVLFFMDDKEFRSPTLDTRILMRAFTNPELRVNLVFNSRMAEEWLDRYIDQ